LKRRKGKNYLYHAPDTDSGWLRVSLIQRDKLTRENQGTYGGESAKVGGTLRTSGDNIHVAWETRSEEDGVPIYHYWWAVGRSHGPELSREALFTYTILIGRREHAETKETVSLLSNLIANAEFYDLAQEGSIN
jgi:hypothetical protein